MLQACRCLQAVSAAPLLAELSRGMKLTNVSVDDSLLLVGLDNNVANGVNDGRVAVLRNQRRFRWSFAARAVEQTELYSRPDKQPPGGVRASTLQRRSGCHWL